RSVTQGTSQGETASLTWGEGADITPRAIVEAHDLQQGINGDLADLLAEPAGTSDELQILLGSDAVVQHWLFGHVADPIAHRPGPHHSVIAMDGNAAGR